MQPTASRHVSSSECDEEADGALGEPVWNPLSLLADLELRLGLPPATVSAATRLQAYASLLATLVPRAPFYGGSLEVDLLGTSRTLLEWRDGLVEAGWDGSPLPSGGERLAALAEVEALAADGLPHGVGDRVARVERELVATTEPVYEAMRLLEPLEAWPGRWRRIFGLLKKGGCKVGVEPSSNVSAHGDGDLQQVQRLLSPPGGRADSCQWTGDGSLVWMRARTAWELAEGVVGFIRQHASRDCVVVRAGDAAPLEAALELQGAPSMGHHATTPLRSPLQVLPLALSMAFHPRDPFRALELLTLPDGPFRGSVARFLARALGTAPGIGSRAWRRAKEMIGTPLDATDEDACTRARPVSHVSRSGSSARPRIGPEGPRVASYRLWWISSLLGRQGVSTRAAEKHGTPF